MPLLPLCCIYELDVPKQVGGGRGWVGNPVHLSFLASFIFTLASTVMREQKAPALTLKRRTVLGCIFSVFCVPELSSLSFSELRKAADAYPFQGWEGRRLVAQLLCSISDVPKFISDCGVSAIKNAGSMSLVLIPDVLKFTSVWPQWPAFASLNLSPGIRTLAKDFGCHFGGDGQSHSEGVYSGSDTGIIFLLCFQR